MNDVQTDQYLISLTKVLPLGVLKKNNGVPSLVEISSNLASVKTVTVDNQKVDGTQEGQDQREEICFEICVLLGGH